MKCRRCCKEARSVCRSAAQRGVARAPSTLNMCGWGRRRACGPRHFAAKHSQLRARPPRVHGIHHIEPEVHGARQALVGQRARQSASRGTGDTRGQADGLAVPAWHRQRQRRLPQGCSLRRIPWAAGCRTTEQAWSSQGMGCRYRAAAPRRAMLAGRAPRRAPSTAPPQTARMPGERCRVVV